MSRFDNKITSKVLELDGVRFSMMEIVSIDDENSSELLFTHIDEKTGLTWQATVDRTRRTPRELANVTFDGKYMTVGSSCSYSSTDSGTLYMGYMGVDYGTHPRLNAFPEVDGFKLAKLVVTYLTTQMDMWVSFSGASDLLTKIYAKFTKEFGGFKASDGDGGFWIPSKSGSRKLGECKIFIDKVDKNSYLSVSEIINSFSTSYWGSGDKKARIEALEEAIGWMRKDYEESIKAEHVEVEIEELD